MTWRSLPDLLRTPGGEVAGGGGAPAEGGSGEESPPKWFATYTERMDKIDKRLGDMGRQLAKQNEARKGKDTPEAKPEGDAKPEPALAQGLSSEDVRKEMLVARKYGEVLSKLNDKARKRLEQMEEDGRPFSDLLDAASLALDLQGDAPSNGQERQNTPRGHGATPAAPTVSGSWPKTWSEAARLRKEKPDVFDRMVEQGLDLDKLPRS